MATVTRISKVVFLCQREEKEGAERTGDTRSLYYAGFPLADNLISIRILIKMRDRDSERGEQCTPDETCAKAAKAQPHTLLFL